MPLATAGIVGVAVGTAFASLVLTATFFLLLRRHENTLRQYALVQEAKKKDEIVPVIREKANNEYWFHRRMAEDFDEIHMIKIIEPGDEFDKVWLQKYKGVSFGRTIYRECGITADAPPLTFSPAAGNANDQAPFDIPAAITLYFDGQLELGIDHRIISRLLIESNHLTRSWAIEFLLNKVAFSFFNLDSNPKYSMLPPKILELAEELRVRAPTSLDNFTDRDYNQENPNPFFQHYARWITLTFGMYGRTDMPPEVHASMKRGVDFLMTVLRPILKPETLDEARKRFEKAVDAARQMAIYCNDRHTTIVANWDYTTQKDPEVVDVGEPQEIPPFDQMAEKTLVMRPAFLIVTSPVTGMPLVTPFIRAPADLHKFEEDHWEELTKDL